MYFNSIFLFYLYKQILEKLLGINFGIAKKYSVNSVNNLVHLPYIIYTFKLVAFPHHRHKACVVRDKKNISVFILHA